MPNSNRDGARQMTHMLSSNVTYCRHMIVIHTAQKKAPTLVTGTGTAALGTRTLLFQSTSERPRFEAL